MTVCGFNHVNEHLVIASEVLLAKQSTNIGKAKVFE